MEMLKLSLGFFLQDFPDPAELGEQSSDISPLDDMGPEMGAAGETTGAT